MKFNPGFAIEPVFSKMVFRYGLGVFGPEVEQRKIDAIRKSLMDPDCQGPEIVYAISMDVGKEADRNDLVERNLLYGAVLYAEGRLGQEPIRSQGHIHAISASCGQSTPEVYEIWSGKGIIYMQESATDQPGRCFAVEGHPGDVIIVPPGWAHATISADPNQPLAFGAWCVRDFGFDYDLVREHEGMAFFPILEGDEIRWVKNENYEACELVEKRPNDYQELNLDPQKAIYRQYQENPSKFDFVKEPSLASEIWENFIP